MRRLAATVAAAAVLLGRGARHSAAAAERRATGALELPRQLGPRGVGRSGVLGLLLLVAPPSGAQIELDIDRLDTNGDGNVDKEEFMLAVRDVITEQQGDDEALRKFLYRFSAALFDACDVDANGVLSDRELNFGEFLTAAYAGSESALSPHGENDFSRSTVEGLMKQIDADNDGRIDKEEFQALAKRDFSSQRWMFSLLRGHDMSARLGAIWERADVTEDGFLNLREVQFASILLFNTVVELTYVALNQLLDADGDGTIERSEAKALQADGFSPNISERLAVALEHFDTADYNHDGRLSNNELFWLASRVAEHVPQHF